MCIAFKAQIYERKESIAIGADEYGPRSGIIPLEDLVEVELGPIVDRRDEKSHYTKAGDGVIIASASWKLGNLNLGIELPSENQMVTIGGWLTEQSRGHPKTWNSVM